MINATKIWNIFSDGHVRYVRVKDDVASITNRQVLIRKVLPPGTKEPGLYHVGIYNELKQAVVPPKDLLNYPDVDLLESFFSNLKPLCSLDIPVRNSLIDYARKINDMKDNIIISVDRMRPRYAAEPAFQYPFNLDPEILISAHYLEIVLLTFKDYPVLKVGRANGPESPLIIGLNWGSCAFIAPFSNQWNTH
jgi:hypothetical protein